MIIISVQIQCISMGVCAPAKEFANQSKIGQTLIFLKSTGLRMSS